MTEMMCGGMI